jgi:hypothetical protein
VQLRLLNEAGQSIKEWQSRPAAGSYPTTVWQPSQIVQDVWPLQVGPDTPVGLYSLEIAVVGSDQPPLVIPGLEVWSQPLTYAVPAMQTELRVEVGQNLTLLGYDLYLDARGEQQVVLAPQFYWQSRADFQESYELLVTLRQAETNEMVQNWQLPLGLVGPKAQWKAQEVLNTIYQLETQVALGQRYHLELAVQKINTAQPEPITLPDGSVTEVLRIEDIQDKVVVRTANN